ncbi:conserved hypothetical protein [Ricinus communis]|uniref:Uncharacterized protein n=1 Tax=Ricinus communis TaxID=3988 RepID=B9TK16_RICCO|nr:conserved hypothetical protein [Ricinus communis]
MLCENLPRTPPSHVLETIMSRCGSAAKALGSAQGRFSSAQDNSTGVGARIPSL